jgi:hypothetical protein
MTFDEKQQEGILSTTNQWHTYWAHGDLYYKSK